MKSFSKPETETQRKSTQKTIIQLQNELITILKPTYFYVKEQVFIYAAVSKKNRIQALFDEYFTTFSKETCLEKLILTADKLISQLEEFLKEYLLQ